MQGDKKEKYAKENKATTWSEIQTDFVTKQELFVIFLFLLTSRDGVYRKGVQNGVNPALISKCTMGREVNTREQVYQG